MRRMRREKILVRDLQEKTGEGGGGGGEHAGGGNQRK